METSRHQLFYNPEWIKGAFTGCVSLLVAFALAVITNRYATRVSGAPVGDLVLDNLPLADVSTIHIYGATAFWLFILLFCLRHFEYLPFTLKCTAVFMIVRALFVSLTHLGPPHNTLSIPGNITALYTSAGDLFFSGHVGGPFLFALIFQQHKTVHLLCLTATAFFAAIVWIGHIHYSIDILAAPFIAHSIYTVMTRYCNDRRFFQTGLS